MDTEPAGIDVGKIQPKTHDKGINLQVCDRAFELENWLSTTKRWMRPNLYLGAFRFEHVDL